MEPHKLRRRRRSSSRDQIQFFTCARPGRSKGSTESVPDSVVDKWVNRLPGGTKTTVVSLLGRKPNGLSEFSFYSFSSAIETPDDRFGTPQEQALGAFINHTEVTTLPSQQVLDDLAAFQQILFTNPRVREVAEAVDAGTVAPDPDPPLTELEEQGEAVFTRACAQCHGGPGQSTSQAPVVRFHTIVTQCPRLGDPVSPARFAFVPCPPRLARNARTYEIALSVPTPSPTGLLPAGTKIRGTSSDPGRALITGSWADLRS
jgi:hypothetical protein